MNSPRSRPYFSGLRQRTYFCTYSWLVLPRLLDPPDYGLLAALFGFVGLVNVVLVAVQISVAKFVARLSVRDASEFLRFSWRTTMYLSLGLFLVLLAASSLIGSYLHTDSVIALVSMVALAALYLPWDVMLGAYQGSARLKAFGFLTFFQAFARALSLGVLLVTSDPDIVILAAAVLMIPPIVLGFYLYSRTLRIRRPQRGTSSIIGALRLSPSSLAVTLAVSFLSFGDVVVVRHVYPPTAAGLYAGVALIGRVVLFMAFAVNAAFYPRFAGRSAEDSSTGFALRTAVVIVLFASGFVAIGVWVFPQFALRAVVGSGYESGLVLVREYAVASLLFAVGSVFAYFNLAKDMVFYAALVAAPFLILQTILPLLIDNDLEHLVRVTAVVGGAFLVFSSVSTWMGGFRGSMRLASDIRGTYSYE